jgi:alpha/beta superfamily hydrolase
MRQAAIGFYSNKLSLEGILTVPQESQGPYAALVVCHPHPVLGGNMENPVVTAICRAADQEGIATLRFNFRGVGESEGEFSNGEGEQQDVRSALNILKQWPEIHPKMLALAGYSFGASVVLTGLRHYKAARSLVFIAPPISSLQTSRILKDKRPKLFLVGDEDRIVPPVELQRAIDQVHPPVQYAEIAQADHSLHRMENAVADRVVTFLKGTLSGQR